jgi:hypothetical protein
MQRNLATHERAGTRRADYLVAYPFAHRGVLADGAEEPKADDGDRPADPIDEAILFRQGDGHNTDKAEWGGGYCGGEEVNSRSQWRCAEASLEEYFTAAFVSSGLVQVTYHKQRY